MELVCETGARIKITDAPVVRVVIKKRTIGDGIEMVYDMVLETAEGGVNWDRMAGGIGHGVIFWGRMRDRLTGVK